MERAYEALKRRIVSLKLQPGMRLDQARLERELGLGRTPIREALFRLTSEGLVDANHNQGFVVRPLTLDDAAALFETLLVFERFSARLATHRISAPELAALKVRYDAIQAAVEHQDYLRITLENSLFHREIAAATHNHFVHTFADTLQTQAQRLAYISFSRRLSRHGTLKEHFRRAQRDHRELLRCFSARDADGADRVITAHTLLFRSRIEAMLGSVPAEAFPLDTRPRVLRAAPRGGAGVADRRRFETARRPSGH